jgi:hypothetical protein
MLSSLRGQVNYYYKGGTMTIYLICAVAIVNLLCGFVLGKYHERWEWNQLMKTSIIRNVRKQCADLGL